MGELFLPFNSVFLCQELVGVGAVSFPGSFCDRLALFRLRMYFWGHKYDRLIEMVQVLFSSKKKHLRNLTFDIGYKYGFSFLKELYFVIEF